MTSLVLDPIGVIRTPFRDKASAPRQPAAALGTEGTVELAAGRGFEDALTDLAGWERIWLLFWFHLNEPGSFRPKVLPPRSDVRRGLFATRSPHRPNPLGMSAVRLVAVEGLVLRVLDVDIVDGTPLLDVKPYVPYADAFPEASSGWLESKDPRPRYEVRFSVLAREQADFLQERFGVELAAGITEALALGPQPHAYRRIRREGRHYRLARRDWRAIFDVEGLVITVLALDSGYSPRDLAGAAPSLASHVAFVARYGRPRLG